MQLPITSNHKLLYILWGLPFAWRSLHSFIYYSVDFISQNYSWNGKLKVNWLNDMLTMLIFFFFLQWFKARSLWHPLRLWFQAYMKLSARCLNDVTHRHWLHCFKCKKPLSLAHHYGFLKGREGYVLLKVLDSQTLQATCSTLSLWHHRNSPGFL